MTNWFSLDGFFSIERYWQMMKCICKARKESCRRLIIYFRQLQGEALKCLDRFVWRLIIDKRLPWINYKYGNNYILHFNFSRRWHALFLCQSSLKGVVTIKKKCEPLEIWTSVQAFGPQKIGFSQRTPIVLLKQLNKKFWTINFSNLISTK